MKQQSEKEQRTKKRNDILPRLKPKATRAYPAASLFVGFPSSYFLLLPPSHFFAGFVLGCFFLSFCLVDPDSIPQGHFGREQHRGREDIRPERDTSGELVWPSLLFDVSLLFVVCVFVVCSQFVLYCCSCVFVFGLIVVPCLCCLSRIVAFAQLLCLLLVSVAECFA